MLYCTECCALNAVLMPGRLKGDFVVCKQFANASHGGLLVFVGASLRQKELTMADQCLRYGMTISLSWADGAVYLQGTIPLPPALLTVLDQATITLYLARKVGRDFV